jgi:hypothetical protein
VVALNEICAVHVGLHGLFPNVAVTPVGRVEVTEKVTGLGEPLLRVATIGKARDGVTVPWSNVTVLGAEMLKSKAGAVTVTLTLAVAPEAVAPAGLPLTTRVNGPVGVEYVVEIVKTSLAPVVVGVTLAEAKLQLTPVGRGVAQDKVTLWAELAVRVAVIVTLPELPAVMLTGPLLDNE